jgi:uncharacterized protein YoxC
MNIVIAILLIAIVVLLIGIYNIGNEMLQAIKLLYRIPENMDESDVESLPEDSNPLNNKKEQ